jgi:predicted GNAT family acetyltransferase
MKLELDRCFKNTQISNSIKIHGVGAKLFHKDGRTDRQTDMMKLTVTFCSFENAPKNND